MRNVSALSLLLLAAPSAAQEPAADPACANVRVVLPPELARWSEPVPVSAGVKPGDGATVSLSRAALVSLHPARHLALSPAPGRPAAGDTSGGTLALAIPAAGVYRIALGGAAWIDLVKDGKAVDSTAHAHGPRCTGVRKIVDFRLTPGSYTIQLSGSTGGTLALLVAKP